MGREAKTHAWISIVAGALTILGAVGSVTLAAGNRDARLGAVEHHATRLDAALDRIEARLDGIEARLSRIEGRLAPRQP